MHRDRPGRDVRQRRDRGRCRSVCLPGLPRSHRGWMWMSAARVIGGIAKGCELARAALIGGETAEHPGMEMSVGYDLAGFCVGVVEEKQIIDGQDIGPETASSAGSSGTHSNGFSLIRRGAGTHGGGWRYADRRPSPDRAAIDPYPDLRGTILKLIREVPVKGIAHITGGGLIENIPRVLPKKLGARLDTTAWPSQPVFDWLRNAGVAEPKCCALSTAALACALWFHRLRSMKHSRYCETATRTPGSSGASYATGMKWCDLVERESAVQCRDLEFGRRNEPPEPDRIRLAEQRPRPHLGRIFRPAQPEPRARGQCRHRSTLPGREGLPGSRGVRRRAGRRDRRLRTGPDRSVGLYANTRWSIRGTLRGPQSSISTPPCCRGLPDCIRTAERSMAGDAFHGCDGPLRHRGTGCRPGIIQCRIPVLEGDDDASLAARIHEVEYMIFPRGRGWCARGWSNFPVVWHIFDGMPMIGAGNGQT